MKDTKKDFYILISIVVAFSTPIIFYKIYTEKQYTKGYKDGVCQTVQLIFKNDGYVPVGLYEIYKKDCDSSNLYYDKE